MKWLERFARDDWLGVHFALNVFIATTLLWLILQRAAGLNPIWAISSMVAASDPVIKQAARTFRGRITNALLGCAVGLVFLVLGGSRDWKLPLALAVTVLLSTYVVRVQVMWRQAPITAAIVIAAGMTHHSDLTALEIANAGYHVYLVEKQPSIGGKMAQFDKTFPTLDCAACILTPKMVSVGHRKDITLLTYSEVESVSGYIGNFKIKVRKKARYVDPEKCTGCGQCWSNCPAIRIPAGRAITMGGKLVNEITTKSRMEEPAHDAR